MRWFLVLALLAIGAVATADDEMQARRDVLRAQARGLTKTNEKIEFWEKELAGAQKQLAFAKRRLGKLPPETVPSNPAVEESRKKWVKLLNESNDRIHEAERQISQAKTGVPERSMEGAEERRQQAIDEAMVAANAREADYREKVIRERSDREKVLTIAQLSQQRDELLFMCHYLPPTRPQSDPTPIADAIREEREEIGRQGEVMFANEKKLRPILERIERNSSNKLLSSIVEKDEARAKKYQDVADECRAAIAESEKRIEGLMPQAKTEKSAWLEREERLRKKEEEDRQKAKQTAKKKALAERGNLSLFTSGDSLEWRLDPAAFKVGHAGILPQWPVFRDGLLRSQRAAAESAARAASQNQSIAEHQRQTVEAWVAGGLAAAKARHNIRVLQVFDDRRLRVSVIGSEFYDWQDFLLEMDSTDGIADDSTLTNASVLVVSGTERYETIAGAIRTIFVLRPIKASDLGEPHWPD